VTINVIRTLVILQIRKVASDKANLFWLFGMPMMFTILMGMMFGSMGSGGGGASLAPAVVVYDQSATPESADLLSRMEGRNQYRIVLADSSGSIDLARTLVLEGQRTAALIIPAGYADSLALAKPAPLYFFYDDKRASAQTARTALEEEVLRLTSQEAGRHAVEGGRFSVARFDSLWNSPRIRLASSTLGRNEDPDEDIGGLSGLSSGFQHTGPSYTLMFVMMFMLMSIRDVVLERQSGTLQRLRLGSASAGVLSIGMMTGFFVVGLAQFAVLLGLNALIPGMDYGDSPATLALLAILFTAISSALALFLATFCRTPGQGDGIGMTASMMMASIGGLWWPLEVVPGFMQDIGLVLPTGRGITIFHNMIGRGWGIAENGDHFIWLGATLAVLLLATRARFQRLVD
jgi:ABC-2 type transport system permease protein